MRVLTTHPRPREGEADQKKSPDRDGRGKNRRLSDMR
jgi:hypothetical protein